VGDGASFFGSKTAENNPWGPWPDCEKQCLLGVWKHICKAASYGPTDLPPSESGFWHVRLNLIGNDERSGDFDVDDFKAFAERLSAGVELTSRDKRRISERASKLAKRRQEANHKLATKLYWQLTGVFWPNCLPKVEVTLGKAHMALRVCELHGSQIFRKNTLKTNTCVNFCVDAG